MAKHRTIRADRLAKLWREVQALPRGQKTGHVEAFARLVGVSPAKVYRDMEALRLNETQVKASTAKRPELREWTAAIWTQVNKCPDGEPIILLDARAAAHAAGLIPAAALAEPIETFHRVGREMGFRDTTRKINALRSEYAHQAVLFDASTSAYFSVIKELPDGDFLLKLNPRPHPDYKNKPVGKDRLRVIVYAFWEMYSGHQWSTYTVSQGENGYDAMAALVEYCQPKADLQDPIQGLMDELWADHGPITKLGSSVDLIQRMGIAVKKGEPYEKERMGGVEQTHRRRWQFERSFYMAVVNGLGKRDPESPADPARGEITLSELNASSAAHRRRLNANPARWQAGKTKIQAWQRSAADRARAGNPIRGLPEHAMETMATEARRRVDQYGVLRWDNQFFEVAEGFHSRWVVARRDLHDHSRVVVEDIETGVRYETKPFEPRTLGEYRAFPKSIADKAQDIGAALPAPSPYSPVGGLSKADTSAAGSSGGNIVALPPRTAAPAPLANPLDAGKYSTLGEALRAFMEWHGMPTFAADYPEEFDAAVDLITSNGLRKDYVRSLAMDLRQAIKAGGH